MSHTPQAESTHLHVVHLIKGLGPGGAERLIVNQLETADPGVESTVLRLITSKSHLVGEVTGAGASSLLIGGGRFWPLALAKRLRSLSPDVVHAHSPILAAAARVIVTSKRLDIPIITTEHNRWPRHHWLTRTLNRITAPLDTRRIAVSNDVKESMSRRLHSSTTVLDHGVPVGQLAALRAKRPELRARLLGDAADDTVVIGIVANFRPEKAYDVFFAAAAKAVAARDNVRFFVIGQGPGEAAFRQQVDQADLASRIEVLGYREDATEVMTAFDIFTLSSLHEGKPVSLMEAFAIGIPVVATRAGGIPEAVTHNHDGLLVDVGDSEALCNAWLRLVDDPALRAEFAQAALRSSAGFDASVSTKSIESMYREVSTGAG